MTGKHDNEIAERLQKKEKPDLSFFFGALKGSELLDEIEEDIRLVRASARSRV